MKNRVNFFKLISIYCAIILLLIVLFPGGNTSANDSEREIKLSLFPSKELFKIDNMKPGDWMTRTLTVQNRGNKDFVYRADARFVSGSELLYNQLLMKVSKDQTVLFEGKLSDFQGFKQRKLAHQNEEELIYTVTFPYESGNEFQGLKTKFQIVFSAEVGGLRQVQGEEDVGVANGELGAKGSVLPKTGGTSPLIYVLIGVVMATTGFILFYKRKMQDFP